MPVTGTLEEFFTAIQECERLYPVSRWSVHGVPVWPFIRTEGRQELSESLPSGGNKIASRSYIFSLLRHATSPLADVIENYRDWQHEKLRLHPVDALLLGDGISRDFIEGAWRDRYGAPIIAALEANGKTSLLMQPRSQILPRERETYSVQWIASWGHLAGRIFRARNVELPGHAEVQALMRARGFDLRALGLPVIERWGVKVAAMGRLFDHVLASTTPKVGIAVSYYWDVGFAFNLACRRHGVLSVDIQHGSQDGRHEAYNFWSVIPPKGYFILPAVFWTWSEEDAQAINDWARQLAGPWHQAVWVGHPQLSTWLDDTSLEVRKFDARIGDIKRRSGNGFDILVALQDLEGYGAVWDALADRIESATPSWRWWLRRHPVPAFNRGAGIKKLLALKGRNIIFDEATSLPMPALLRNVDAVLSLMSSTAVEACFFGHRPIFLTEDARMQFFEIFKADKVEVISDMDTLMVHLAALAEVNGRLRQRPHHRTDLKQTLSTLLSMADEYREAVSNQG